LNDPMLVSDKRYRRVLSVDAVREGAQRPSTSGIVRIPPGFFGIALGLSGLAALWAFAAPTFGGRRRSGDARRTDGDQRGTVST
jgi:hypothetical protein